MHDNTIGEIVGFYSDINQYYRYDRYKTQQYGIERQLGPVDRHEEDRHYYAGPK